MSAGAILATLPAGTNHDFVARRYAAARGLTPEPLACESPRAALHAVLDRRADLALVCAAHPDAPALPAEFHKRLYVVDAFVTQQYRWCTGSMSLLADRRGRAKVIGISLVAGDGDTAFFGGSGRSIPFALSCSAAAA